MIGNRLECLLLAHAEADLLLGLVSEQLSISDTTLFPLAIIPSVQLGSLLP